MPYFLLLTDSLHTFVLTSLPESLDVVVPRVYDNATTARVLTMEFVESVKLTDEKALLACSPTYLLSVP